MDVIDRYARGIQMGRDKQAFDRQQSYMQQLNDLKIQNQQNALARGENTMTLQQMQIEDAQRQQQQQALMDVGKAAQWADTPDKWEQALDFYEQQGMDTSAFRGRFDMRDTVMGLANPDYLKQQKAQENIQKLLQRVPEAQREDIAALTAVDPKAGVEAAKESLEKPKDISALVDTLPEESRATVDALYQIDPDEATKLAKDIAKAKTKPEKITEGMRKNSGYATRMNTAEQTLQAIEAEGYKPGGLAEHLLTGTTYGNWLISDEGQRYRNAQADWVRAKLRQESGAVIGEQEMADEIKTYFPMPGDKPETIKQKADRRKVAENAMIDASGDAYKSPDEGGGAVEMYTVTTAEDFAKVPVGAKFNYRGKEFTKGE